MSIKIATVVAGSTTKEFLKNLVKTQAVSDLLELRVDYIKDLKIEDLDTIKKKLKKKAILTCRKKDEGGYFVGTEKERFEIIKKALELGFDYIDIELSAINKINLTSKKRKSKIICSWHNFQKTPSLNILKKKRDEMRRSRADVFKIVTMVNSEKDIKILMDLLLSKKKNEHMIVLGMGELGQIIRVLSPMMGGYLTFASVGEQKSAPGQIDIKKLKNIYKLLNK